MDLIYTHDSGAKLWQGNIDDVKDLLRRSDSDIRVIGLFAQEHQPDDPSGKYELIKTGYDDDPKFSDWQLEEVGKIADRASDIFSQRLREGRSCLSSCAAGLNRSGLISGLTLMKVAGMGPGDAVRHVQYRRKPQQGLEALFNPRFVELLHKMAASVGSKSTWTEWKR